jgi:hypothetical protein
MSFIRKALNTAGKLAPVAAMVPGVGWAAAAGLAGAGVAGRAMSARAQGPAAPQAAPAPVPQQAAGPDPMESYRNRYEQALFEMPQQNAGEYLQQANQGAFNQFKTQFGENLADLRGHQAGMGRGMGSGFGGRDEDRLFTRMGADLNNTMMANSFRAADLDYGQRNRYMDALGSRIDRADDRMERADVRRDDRADTATAQRLSDKAGKREMWAGLGAGLIGAAGTLGGAYLGSRK